MRTFGTLLVVGVEGTGVYGAGLARYLAAEGVAMVEVDRPDRKMRRFAGKSDPLDAEAAARTALARVRTGVPKQRDGQVEALRNLRVARRSAIDPVVRRGGHREDARSARADQARCPRPGPGGDRRLPGRAGAGGPHPPA